jgi:hypothetical protein
MKHWAITPLIASIHASVKGLFCSSLAMIKYTDGLTGERKPK